jgi:hypothetical protein
MLQNSWNGLQSFKFTAVFQHDDSELGWMEKTRSEKKEKTV